MAYTMIAPLLAVSATKTLTAQTDWEAGEYYNGTVDTKSSAGDMKVQSGSVGTWDAGTPGFPTDTAGYDYWTFDGASYGAAMTTDDTYIYMIGGNRRPYLFRFNPETNTWKQLASAPTDFLYGGSLAYDGAGNIFAIDGQEGVLSSYSGDTTAERHMYKYSIANDTWSRVADAPDTWGLGSSIVSNRNGKIYAVRGVNQDTLWAYTIATNTWDVTLASLPAPYFVYTTNGQPLVYVATSYNGKCTTGCLFTLYGNGNRQFFRYDIAENQWYYNSPTDLTIPVALGGVGYGSSFAYDTANSNLYLLHGNQQAYFSKYAVTTETWDAAAATTAEAPGPVYYGGVSVYLNGYVYSLKGYGVPDFWRYDITANVWNSVSTPAASGNAGEDGHVVFVPDATCPDAAAGDCLYVLRGANTNTYWRYNITAKTWTTLSSTNLGTLQAGSSSCWNGADLIYALRGNSTYNFYQYSISGNAWTVQTTIPTTHTGAGAYPVSPTTQVVSYGGAVTCVGTNLYAMKGAANANGSNHFYLWNGATWTQKAVVPQRVFVGGALVNNGTYVYALAGNQRGDFYRYDTAGDSWTAMTSLPSATNYTASLAYDGTGNIYAISGDYDKKMWRYNISGNSWTRVADLPARVGYANALAYDTAANVLYAENGMTTYNLWRFTPTTNNYITTATWISATQDLNFVSGWEQLSATHPTPGSSSVSIATRSSTDKVAWSAWETVLNASAADSSTTDLSAITTPARRYIQLRVTLTSDGSNTPTFSDLTVTYTKDGTAPTNPSATGYADSTKATSLTSGNSYYYVTPYFELSDATDSQSGVAGYYVYFGTNSGFDPSSSEDYYQTGTTYEVNTPLIGGNSYYLRVATKDVTGNVASPQTKFTYVYSGVTNVVAQTWTTQANFEATGTTSSNLNTAANSGTDVTLSAVSGGTWMDLPATFGTASVTTAYNDSALAWNGNDTIFVLRSTNSKTFLKYTISTKTWATLTNIGSTANAYPGTTIVYVPTGSQCADSQGCVFALVGNSSTEFQRYNVQANTWTSRTAITAAVSYGASLVWTGGDYLYAERGGGATDFYRYSISGNSWTPRTTPDYAFNYGAGLVYVPPGTYCSDVSGCIFARRGGGSNHFWRYDINSNSWSYRTAPPSAAPTKGNFGATMVYNNGVIYFVGGYATTDFVKYTILTDTWSTLADLPATHYYGSSTGMVYDTSTDTIYILRSYNEYSFLSYDVTNDKWRNPTIPHGMSSNGFNYGGLAFDGTDTLYIARGGNLNDFYKYVVSTQVWTRLENIPMRMYTGSDLAYISGKVYALTGAPPYGEAATRFYSYDPTTDKWTRLADTPNTVSYGTKLVWDGANTIYTARGGNTTTYYSYSISGNTWSTQASTVPAAVNNGGCAVRSGTAIYQVRATNTLNFYKCNLDTGAGTCTWIADGGGGDPANAPASPGVLTNGAACTLDNGNIFVPRGNTTNTDFLVYNISGDSWTNRTLNNFYNDGRMEAGPNGILYGFRGYATSTMDRYVQPTATTSFQRIGTWTSQIIDAGTAIDYNGVTVNAAFPANTALKVETRTCSAAGCATDPNDAGWSAWDEASNLRTISSARYYTVDSATARYVQVKLTFTSDRIYTPTVSDVTLNYYSDSTAPTNPSALTSLNQSGGSAITTGNWYNYSGPYFSWSGASDNAGGIGIQGYYVYFGTNSSADPTTDGALQAGATYTASSLQTSQTYYLRIKTKDYAGNVSAAAWAPFTYSYDSVAPSRPTNLQANPAVPSATNSFAFSWTAGSDSGGSPSFQYCYKRYFSAGNQDASETCVSSATTTLSGITALTEGTNYLYIRSKDAAGNFSNNGDYETVAYRWAQTPPSLPTNVTHGSTADPYQHTFAWNAPTSAAFDITAYCYQVNAVPTASYCTNGTYGRWTTTSETSGRFLAAFNTPNTHPGNDNKFYIVAKDEAGNVDYNATFNCTTGAGCITFSSTTTAPNPPQNVSITDASDRVAQTFRLTLGWKKPADNPGSQLYSYRVYRSVDGTTYVQRETLLNVSGQDDYAYTDVALSNAITYYYQVKAVDAAGAESSAGTTVSKKPEGKFTSPPNLVGNPSIQPRIRSAAIQWLTDNPDGHPASSFVQYGLTTSYGGEQGNSDLTGTHTVTLIDLTPKTTYNFRLKWIDQDGNIGYSPNYSFTTNDAPSAPANLTVNPATNTANHFSFAWSAPNDAGVTVAGYFYSVNSTPTKDNTSFIKTSAVGPVAAASRQGVNTFYVVAVDDFGNVNYDNYMSIEFEVHTAAPASPRNVVITDSSDRDNKRYSITLTWDPPSEITAASGGSDINYTIYRSENEGQNFSSIATIKSTGYLDTGLNSTKKYTYKITAQDTAGATSVSTTPLAKVPEGRYTAPPAITKAAVAAPDSFSAVITWSTERGASSFVDFGATADNLAEEQGTADLIPDHSVKVTGLKAQTTYYYKVKSIDVDQNVAYSDVQSFTTLEAPRVMNVKITDVRLKDAIVSWEVNKEATAIINYGKTANYGLTYNADGANYSTKHTVKLENLSDSTTYHLRLGGVDRNDNSIVSDDYVFTTLTFPKVDNITTKNKSQGQTEIAWKSNVPTTSSVEYYGDTIPPKTQGNTSLVTDHTILLFGLEDATQYKFKVRGSDQFGYEAVSPEQNFTTLEDTTPPEIFGVKSESNTIGSGETSKIQIVVSWKTNEPTTSKVEFGVGLSGSEFTDSTDENAELVLDHLVVIADLAQAKTYHFRVVSRDKAGNQTKSGSYSVLTSRKRESFVQLIVTNLESTFSWLGNIGKLTGR